MRPDDNHLRRGSEPAGISRGEFWLGLAAGLALYAGAVAFVALIAARLMGFV
jgi:hypothetical protein